MASAYGVLYPRGEEGRERLTSVQLFNVTATLRTRSEKDSAVVLFCFCFFRRQATQGVLPQYGGGVSRSRSRSRSSSADFGSQKWFRQCVFRGRGRGWLCLSCVEQPSTMVSRVLTGNAQNAFHGCPSCPPLSLVISRSLVLSLCIRKDG